MAKLIRIVNKQSKRAMRAKLPSITINLRLSESALQENYDAKTFLQEVKAVKEDIMHTVHRALLGYEYGDVIVDSIEVE